MGLPWFKVATDFTDHPKVQQLAEELSISEFSAIGLVLQLWSWTAKYCPDGAMTPQEFQWSLRRNSAHCFKQFSADPISPISVEDIGAALLRSGWVQKNGPDAYEIHDWKEFNWEYFQQVEMRKALDRKRKLSKKSAGIPAEPDSGNPSTPNRGNRRKSAVQIRGDKSRGEDLKSIGAVPKNGTPPAAELKLEPSARKRKTGEQTKTELPWFKPLQVQICAVFLEVTSEPYKWQGEKDTDALKRIYATAPDGAPEIVWKWRFAVSQPVGKWRRCRTLAELSSKWNEFAGVLNEPAESERDPLTGIALKS